MSNSNSNFAKTVGVWAAIATIIGTCVAIIALIPAFGAWLGTKEPTPYPPQPTRVVTVIVEQTTIVKQPTSRPPNTPIPQPTDKPESSYPDPTQFLEDYFSLLNNRYYQEAWSKLSASFQSNMSYDEYVSFWDTVDKAVISLTDIQSQTNTEVIIYAEIVYYYKQGYSTTGHTTYKLIKDPSSSSWLFYPN